MTHPTHTRKEAAALGLAKYWTGAPCLRGHTAWRSTSTGACTACVAGYRAQYAVKTNTATAARRGGATVYTALVHPDDVPAVQQLVDALTVARSLS